MQRSLRQPLQAMATLLRRPADRPRSACRCAVPIVLVLTRLRRYSYSYSHLIRPGDAVAPPFSWMTPNSGAWHVPDPASASRSTSRILHGRSMCGAALAKQRARQRGLASVAVSGRRSHPASSAGVTREWPASSLPRFPWSRLAADEKPRGSLRSGILVMRWANSPASPSAAAVNRTAEPSAPLRGSLRAFRDLRGYPFSCGDRAATVSFPPAITGSSCRFAASDRTRRETNPRPCTRAAGTCWANQPRPGSRMSPRRETRVESAMGSPPAAPPIRLYLAAMCPAPDFQLESF